MTKTIFEWTWLTENGERILFIKFSQTPKATDYTDCFSQALADNRDKEFKMLCDVRLSHNMMNYDSDTAILYESLSSLGIETFAASLIVSDSLYHLKEKIINEFARINRIPFVMKSFNNYDDARKWLADFTFPTHKK